MFGSLADAPRLAEWVLDEHSHPDVLVSDAGAGFASDPKVREQRKDGYEFRFASINWHPCRSRGHRQVKG
jgi:hypothetical protein